MTDIKLFWLTGDGVSELDGTPVAASSRAVQNRSRFA